jgi:hypothetical protein
MTTKTYKCGQFTCKTYKKTAGKGWEVGMTLKGHPVFVGNFIHAKEATAWWTKMNLEVKKFSKKFGVGHKAPFAWFCKFMSNHMYQTYYSHLDTQFAKYQRGYTQAVKQDVRRFAHYTKHARTTAATHHTSYRRAG